MVENLLRVFFKRLPPFAEKTPPGAVYGTRVALRPCATTDCRWMHGLRQIVRFGDLIAYLREGAKANKAIYRHCTRSRPAMTHVKKRNEQRKKSALTPSASLIQRVPLFLLLFFPTKNCRKFALIPGSAGFEICSINFSSIFVLGYPQTEICQIEEAAPFVFRSQIPPT